MADPDFSQENTSRGLTYLAADRIFQTIRFWRPIVNQGQNQGGGNSNTPYILFFGIVFLMLAALQFSSGFTEKTLFSFFIWVLIIMIASLFIFAFTRRLGPRLEPDAGDAPDGKDSNDTKQRETSFNRLLLTLRASYMFMIVSLGVCVVPFAAPESVAWQQSAEAYRASPFQILPGCALDKDARLPISCDNPTAGAQWIVGLGSTVAGPNALDPLETATLLQDRLEKVSEALGALSEAEPDLREARLNQAFTAIESFRATLNTLDRLASDLSTRAGEAEAVARQGAALFQNVQSVEDVTGNLDSLRAQLESVSERLDQFVGASPTLPLRAELSGGLVVPLFVVVLSLLGGSISMTRKLPEIQLRTAVGYPEWHEREIAKGTKGLRPPLEAANARDFLLFQILQVITAPFLAMVIYASLEPESTTASVLIGFGAGFASEPLLLRLRAMIDQLASGETTTDGSQSAATETPENAATTAQGAAGRSDAEGARRAVQSVKKKIKTS